MCQPPPTPHLSTEAGRVKSWRPDLWGLRVILRKSRLDNHAVTDTARRRSCVGDDLLVFMDVEQTASGKLPAPPLRPVCPPPHPPTPTLV